MNTDLSASIRLELGLNISGMAGAARPAWASGARPPDRPAAVAPVTWAPAAARSATT